MIPALTSLLMLGFAETTSQTAPPQAKMAAPAPAQAPLFPLRNVRLLDSPFLEAAHANRKYLLAHDPDRLMAGLRREAGLEPKEPTYENWENIGLDGHTVGHYVSALSQMIAAGYDPGGELKKRVDYLVDEFAACQDALGTGYVGGVPGSVEFWKKIAAGEVGAVWEKWVPWYNLHKDFAGMRDAYVLAGNPKAKTVLVGMSDWAYDVTKNLSDQQMQQMLNSEHGGMNEILADVYAITGDKKYLTLAERFSHQALLQPLSKGEDNLTGLHANTQIPKIIGFERIASLGGDSKGRAAAEFFWETVTQNRSIAFGGNSVSEHFNDPKDFSGLLRHREGPETCNTYNMLRLTEDLFSTEPDAKYVDYYERALYNHILASIHAEKPGYVYFTPIRPGHYRVYSQPEQAFWCCVGTGMENPGLYGQMIYAQAKDGVYVNLFIPSEVEVGSGMTLRQENDFPNQESTMLTVETDQPKEMTLHLRHPVWAKAGEFGVRVNGETWETDSQPSSYVAIKRTWNNGDRIEVSLPMHPSVEKLPDGSSWGAILYGPFVMAAKTGTEDMQGLFAGSGRGDHIAHGPLVALDKMPALLTTPEELPAHLQKDSEAQGLQLQLKDVMVPAQKEGITLIPFYRLHESRYQMYWDFTTKEALAERQARLAKEEAARLARDAATIDRVAVGEQQPETDHAMTGEEMETGIYNGRRWRHGKVIQYTLNSKKEKDISLSVTYSGDDRDRVFEIYANDTLIATQELKGEHRGQFFEVLYPIPNEVIESAPDGMVKVRFVAKQWLAGGLYDVRLLRKH